MIPNLLLAATLVATPSDSALRAYSRLPLARARVTVDGRTYELVRPTFDAAGVGWRSVQGFPPPRPAVFVDGNRDSLKTPPNPVPWERIQQLESMGMRGPSGAGRGALVGLVVIGVPAFGLAAALIGTPVEIEAGTLFGTAFSLTIMATLVGATLGHFLVPRTAQWEQLAPPSGPSPSAGSAADAPRPAAPDSARSE